MIEDLAVALERVTGKWWEHPDYKAYRNARYYLLLAERGKIPDFPAPPTITLEDALAEEQKALHEMQYIVGLFCRGQTDLRSVADSSANWALHENTFRRVNDYESDRNQHAGRAEEEEFTDTGHVKPSVHPTAVGARKPWDKRERLRAALANIKIPDRDRKIR